MDDNWTAGYSLDEDNECSDTEGKPMALTERQDTFRPAARPGVDFGSSEPLPTLSCAAVRILFAFEKPTFPSVSLRRAFELAQQLDGDLCLLRVVPPIGSVGSSDTNRSTRDVIATRRWAGETLGASFSGQRLQVRTGAFVEQTASHARQLGADLIAMPPGQRGFGTTVTTLAEVSRLPVFVARASRSHGAIIAATDLEDAEYPVLRKAAELAVQLDAPVVAVHNLSHIDLMTGPGAAWTMTVTPNPELRELYRQKLVRVSKRLQAHAATVVASEESPVDAILREARLRNADVVVVGTHRSWFARVIGASVAAQVVNQAWRSVLVTPLDASPWPMTAPPERA